MTGTEKQITWAEEIKNMFLNHPIIGIPKKLEAKKITEARYVKRITEGTGNEKTQKYLAFAKKDVAELEILINKINTETDAVWFIDNRELAHQL